jgi:hypothetical protein
VFVPRGQARGIDESLISRDEVIALLSNVSDAAVSLRAIVNLLRDGDDEEED